MQTQQLIQNILLFSLHKNGRWGLTEGLTLIFALIWFFVELFLLAVVLYLAGLIVVGKKRAHLSDAFMMSFLGTVLSTFFAIFIPYGLIALFLGVLVWLLLIKRLFETGWLGAIAVGILAIIIFVAILVLLALAFGTLGTIIKWLSTTL